MFSAGQQIGEYQLVAKLGKGGFGEVWLAEKKSEFFTKRVAVKLPHDEQVNFETIRREAQLWEQASGHPNVLPIIDAAVYNGQVVIVSEYADGGSVADKLKTHGKLPITQAVDLTLGILNGLEFLHSKQIIHRDIKPQNILLQGSTPRLADFGISRAMNTSTISSLVIGTDAYMSPESFDGKRSVQTDIWSVGVVLYQLLAENLPFPQEHPSERIFAILTKEFPPLSDDVPNSLQRIVAKALAKMPENRYQSANEMHGELDKALVGIKHPTLAKTDVLHTPLPNETVSNVSAVDKLFKTEEPEKETLVNHLQTPVITNPPIQPESIQTQFKQVNFPENKPLPAEAPKFADKTPNDGHPRQNPMVIAPQIQKKPVINSFKQENITSPEQKSKVASKIGGIISGVLVLGLISAIIVGGYFLLNSNYIRQSMLPPIESSQLIPFRKGDKWGYSDAQKRIYIAPQFIYDAKPFSEDLALVAGGFSEGGYIDKTGKFVIQANLKTKYSESFKEGLAKVSVNDGLIKTEVNEKYGFIDKSGNMVIQPKYYSAESFFEGLAMVCLEEPNNKVKIFPDCGFVDKSGSEVIPLKYFNVHSFSEGLAAVKDKTTAVKTNNSKGESYYIGGKVIFLDKTGKVILNPSESESNWFFPQFSEGLSAIAGTDSNARYIDKSGKVIIQTEYLKAKPFSEGLAGVCKSSDSKCGFIDRTGKLVIPLQYEAVCDFSEGLAAVKSNGTVGFIDKTGKAVIPFKYDDFVFSNLKFKNGIVKVRFGGKDFYIGKDGTEYYEP